MKGHAITIEWTDSAKRVNCIQISEHYNLIVLPSFEDLIANSIILITKAASSGLTSKDSLFPLLTTSATLINQSIYLPGRVGTRSVELSALYRVPLSSKASIPKSGWRTPPVPAAFSWSSCGSIPNFIKVEMVPLTLNLNCGAANERIDALAVAIRGNLRSEELG